MALSELFEKKYDEFDLGFKEALARQFLKYFELKEIPELLRAELSMRGFQNLVDVCLSTHLAYVNKHIHYLAIIFSENNGYDNLSEAVELAAMTDAITYIYAAAKEIGKPDQTFLFLYLESFSLSDRFIEAVSIANDSLTKNDFNLKAALAKNKSVTIP